MLLCLYFLYHRVFDLIFSVGVTNGKKKVTWLRVGERQKEEALLLYRSVCNSYYRDCLKETSDTLYQFILNTVNEW